MAFSNNPLYDTRSTKRIPLVYDFKLQSGATDFGTGDSNVYSGLENILPLKQSEASPSEMYGITRPGLTTHSLTTATGGTCRGVYVWEKFVSVSTYYFMVTQDGVTNTRIWSSPDGVNWTNTISWTSSAVTPCNFTEFITDTGTKSLVLLTGDRGYVFTSDVGGTQIVDADFPANHVPFPIFLNGRLHVAKVNTGDIYCSDLNDPTAWTAGNFISSEVYPDDVQALVKINNYIVAIGSIGAEYFYDAGNPTGSPLARMEAALHDFGTVFPYSIAEHKGGMTLLARNNAGGISIKQVDGFAVKDITTESVSTLITKYLTNNSSNNLRVRGNYLSCYGDLYYMLTFDGTLPVGSGVVIGASVGTLVFSFSTNLWTRFTYTSVDHADQFPVFFVAQSNSTSGNMFVAGTTFTKVFYGTLSELSPLDDGSPIPQTINIPPLGFGDPNYKTMSRVGITVNTTVPSTAITFSYNDIPMSGTFTSAGNFGNLTTYPFITQLGGFRRRQVKLTTTTSTAAISWYFLDCDINKGSR